MIVKVKLSQGGAELWPKLGKCFGSNEKPLDFVLAFLCLPTSHLMEHVFFFLVGLSHETTFRDHKTAQCIRSDWLFLTTLFLKFPNLQCKQRRNYVRYFIKAHTSCKLPSIFAAHFSLIEEIYKLSLVSRKRNKGLKKNCGFIPRKHMALVLKRLHNDF